MGAYLPHYINKPSISRRRQKQQTRVVRRAAHPAACMIPFLFERYYTTNENPSRTYLNILTLKDTWFLLIRPLRVSSRNMEDRRPDIRSKQGGRNWESDQFSYNLENNAVTLCRITNLE